VIRVLHCLLLGALVAVVVNGLYWLATADLLPLVASVAMSMILCPVFDIAFRLRDIREQQRLNHLYDLPSCEE
jgi:hypothetical protein